MGLWCGIGSSQQRELGGAELLTYDSHEAKRQKRPGQSIGLSTLSQWLTSSSRASLSEGFHHLPTSASRGCRGGGPSILEALGSISSTA